MKLYIIGAGGSAGATEVAVLKSPVANDLFHQDYFGFAQGIGMSEEKFTELREKSQDHGNLEEYLTEQWSSITGRSSWQSKRAAQVEFGLITLYVYTLFQAVSFRTPRRNQYLDFVELLNDKQEEFIIINFNYDTLLDRALITKFGFQLSPTITSYYDNNYLKPHGSVNWFVDPKFAFDKLDSEEVMVEFITSKMYTTDFTGPINIVKPPSYRALNDLDFLRGNDFHPYGLPLVFIPLTNKLYGFHEGLYKELVKQSSLKMVNVDEVTVLGYSAQDSIIEDLLMKVPKDVPLNVFNSYGSEETAKRLNDKWAKQLVTKTTQDIDFSNYMLIERSKIN